MLLVACLLIRTVVHIHAFPNFMNSRVGVLAVSGCRARNAPLDSRSPFWLAVITPCRPDIMSEYGENHYRKVYYGRNCERKWRYPPQIEIENHCVFVASARPVPLAVGALHFKAVCAVSMPNNSEIAENGAILCYWIPSEFPEIIRL